MRIVRRFPKFDYIHDRDSYLMRLCRDKRILHLGCADSKYLDSHALIGRHLHINIVRTAKLAIGIDSDAHALNRLQGEFGINNLYVADAECICGDFESDFDIVLAGELIEHLGNPGRFLDGIRHYMHPGTLLIITTPNLLSLKLMLHSIIGNERVDPLHQIGFTSSLLATLLLNHGIEPTRWLATVEHHGSLKAKIVNFLMRPIFSAFPRYADTIIVEAKLAL